MEDWAAADIFAALSHPTRVRLLRLLIQAGSPGLAAGVLASSLGVAPSTLSHHLAALEQQGLIAHRRRQRHILYRFDAATLRGLIGFLVHDCCDGDPERCGLAIEPGQAARC